MSAFLLVIILTDANEFLKRFSFSYQNSTPVLIFKFGKKSGNKIREDEKKMKILQICRNLMENGVNLSSHAVMIPQETV